MIPNTINQLLRDINQKSRMAMMMIIICHDLLPSSRRGCPQVRLHMHHHPTFILSPYTRHLCLDISSSSSSSQDRPIGPLPAKCWPEALVCTLLQFTSTTSCNNIITSLQVISHQSTWAWSKRTLERNKNGIVILNHLHIHQGSSVLLIPIVTQSPHLSICCPKPLSHHPSSLAAVYPIMFPYLPYT